MNKKLYSLMDWAAIEEVVYGECDHPGKFLGAKNSGRQTLVQAFFPGAAAATLYIDAADSGKGKTVKEEVPMEMADEAGFFAALLPGTNRTDYRYHVTYPVPSEGKKKKETVSRDIRELYNTGVLLTDAEEKRFSSGAERKAYEYMGCHKKTVAGVRGCVFRVWAPEARRVSVIGAFNSWNGLENPMNRLEESGIFELFIPGIEEGELYSYEVLMKGGNLVKKADPYSFYQQTAPECNSVVTQAANYKWGDSAWMDKKKDDLHKSPMSIYTLPVSRLGNGLPGNKTEASALASYIKNMGYTHVELLPLMEYPDDADEGYHTAFFFAVTSRFGKPRDYMSLIDAFHKAGLGVLLEWTPADFSNVSYGLGGFDGTALYEYADPRRGRDPRTGQLMFDFSRPEVWTYLLSALNFWHEVYHIDGFNTLELSAILYLDYYRKPGEWVTNLYGSVEHLEAISFFREMNTMLHKEKVLSITSMRGEFANVTGDDNGGLGFDYVTDYHFTGELIDYLSRDPISRRSFHNQLTNSSVYQYCEHYIMPLGQVNINFGQGGLYERMFGNESEKWANLKLFFGMQMLHTGKKSVIAGQEYADRAAFEQLDLSNVTEKAELSTEVFRAYIKALNAFYAKYPALYAGDDDAEGFEWLLEDAAEDNVLAFARKDAKAYLLCVFNFANKEYEKYEIRVPEDGKYRMVFSSVLSGPADGPTAAAREGDQRHVKLTLAPLSMQIYQYIPYSGEEKAEIDRRRKEREKKLREEEKARKKLHEERSRIRAELKEELDKRLAAAEKAAGKKE